MNTEEGAETTEPTEPSKEDKKEKPKKKKNLVKTIDLPVLLNAPQMTQQQLDLLFEKEVSIHLLILVDSFRVQSRGDRLKLGGILSSSSYIEGCRAVVSGVIWIRLLDSARLIQV